MTERVHTLRLSRIAHELRGPAGVALGAARELAKQAGGGEPFVGMMQRGLNRVLSVADRLSRASALENGLVEFSLRSLDLIPLVSSEAAASVELEHKSNVKLQLELPKEILPVSADPDWLGFCLRELVANAVQHARTTVRVSVTPTSDRAVIAIEDDGPGFREPPALGFDAPPNPRRGVGLSLPICHTVVTKAHGGWLDIEKSELGGARVRVSLRRGGKPG